MRPWPVKMPTQTCWGCYCCWCWWWGSCWQQFVADLKLRFGHKARLLLRLWAQGLVNLLKLAADVWLRLRSWILVKILKLGLAKILSLSLVETLMFSWDYSKLWNFLIKICVVNCNMNSTLGSVVPLAMFHIISPKHPFL